MDIDELVSRCPHATDIHRMSYDQRILMSIPYITSNDDDDCTDLQTLYNTVYSVENSYGSSDRYTVPPFLDNISRTPRKKEHYVSIDKCNCDSLDFVNYMFPIICIVMMVLAVIILLQHNQ